MVYTCYTPGWYTRPYQHPWYTRPYQHPWYTRVSSTLWYTRVSNTLWYTRYVPTMVYPAMYPWYTHPGTPTTPWVYHRTLVHPAHARRYPVAGQWCSGEALGSSRRLIRE